MTDTPKFTVVDRRKSRDAGEDAVSSPEDTKTPPVEMPKPVEAKPAEAKTDTKSETKAGPRLTLVEPPQPKTAAAVAEPPALVDLSDEADAEEEFADEFE